MNGNGDNKEVKKRCPFLGKPCIMNECALYIQITQSKDGVVREGNVCAFGALVQMISELNAKTQPPPPQKIQIPHLLRG